MTDATRAMHIRGATHRRAVVGMTLALATQGALLAILVPFRSHLSIATPALVFVVPVVVGVVIGGFAPGALASVADSSSTTSSSCLPTAP